MAALYITSLEAAVGKSALCAGFAKKLADEGRKIGFFKPLLVAEAPQPPAADEDARFMKQSFSLKEPLESLCPILKPGQLSPKIVEAFRVVSQGKDVVIIEGLTVDGNMAQDSSQVAEVLGAEAIILLRYADALPLARVLTSAQRFAPRLLGVAINHVPGNRLEAAHQRMTILLEKEGIKILGVLPENGALSGVSIGELAEGLGGSILCCPEGSDKLAESVMAGVLCVDPGVEYFKRRDNKAVVTRGERPDIQLAALETSTRGLILCGNVPPIPTVLHRAEDKGVPIILVEQNTIAAIAGIEEVLSQARFRHQSKLSAMERTLAQHFDFPTLYQSLGLTA